jgi:NAD(P)-dependent dehydrogenase (short-subunit alcohol dehydrogenase family)
MTGRVAVVTGATRNIGYAIAEALATAGASVVINALRDDGLERAIEQLDELGPARVVGVAGDLCDRDTTAAIAELALTEFNGADVVVNNALIDGGPDGHTLLAAPRTAWDRQFEGYVHAPLRLLRALAPSMAERDHGAVVNVVSGAAFTPLAGMATYGVTKAALWALTRHLAKELAPTVRVNALCPGTTSESGTLEVPGMETLVRHVPLRRIGQASEVARAALFLASDASIYTTGQLLYADGGRTELIAPE